jgi:ketosteroid isomerase-like protein
LHPAPRVTNIVTMSLTTSNAGELFAAAVATRDFAGARDHLHPEIDFRAMTPTRIWEADGPAGVEDVLRAWLDDADEDIDSIETLGSTAVEDTVRVGWLVHGTDAEGPFVFEQQAYVRERDGRIAWLRVFCSGYRRPE